MKKILFIAFVMLSAINLHAQLPNVRLQDMDGKTVQTGEISNDGKPVIISFWATWCKPCLRELKAIHEVYPDLMVWQKSFYDHIIRNEKEYQEIWKYIDENPVRWSDDEYYL